MKMRLFCLIFLSAMLTPLIASAAEPLPPNTTANSVGKPVSAFDKQLIGTEQSFLDAAERGDVAYVKNAMAEDYSSIGSNGADDDSNDLLDDVRSAAKEKKDDKERPTRYFFEVVRLDDDCAVVSYNTVHPGDRPRYLHISDTWAKDGDQWKLKFRQATPNVWSARDID